MVEPCHFGKEINMHQSPEKEPFSMAFQHAALVAKLAGYAHDLGKANICFQDKLQKSTLTGNQQAQIGDYIRHEWISTWLLYLLSQENTFSLDGLQQAWDELLREESKIHIPCMGNLDTALSAVLFSVCTHHGSLGGNYGKIDESAHIGSRGSVGQQQEKFLSIAMPIPSAGEDGKRWRQVVQEMGHLRKMLSSIDRPRPYWEGVLLIARAALIFADHKISSQMFDGNRGKKEILFANTKNNSIEPEQNATKKKASSKKNKRFLDQPLSWHLLQVGDSSAQNIRMFSGEGMPTLDAEICEKLRKDRAPQGSRFAWQDQASDAMETVGGKLVFNVASTGAGKTLANLKMAVAARQGINVRIAVAFNLRSLTQQTFHAFEDHLHSIDRQRFQKNFSCLLGERGTSKVDFSLEDEDDIDGVAPVDILSSEQLEIPEWLDHIAGANPENKKMIQLLASPVLVSTMDWIVASGEPGQQDRHAKALIRVCTSDLILDEVDSYDVEATVAVMRVVETAASFGRNVIVSSATLSPSLAEGIAIAFATGWKTYQAMVGEEPWQMVIVSDLSEPKIMQSPDKRMAAEFYGNTLQEIAKAIKNKPVTKRYRIADIPENGSPEERFSTAILQSAWSLHQQQAVSYQKLSPDCRLSIGLVRVAHVKPCMQVSAALQKDGRFIVSAYHARDIAERRAWKEQYLDAVLSRKSDNDSWLDALLDREPWLREATGDICLVVVATPVEEVGRDHDFDWAIIEPSSMHSIVQTAGRVNRHRQQFMPEGKTNLVILDRNLQSIQTVGEAVFCNPGLEFFDKSGNVSTHSYHDMKNMLVAENGEPQDVVDAGMVFDAGSRKTLFASCDEKSVRRKMENILSSIERSDGNETDFLLKRFATEYPLRQKVSKNKKEKEKIISIDLSQQSFYWDHNRSKAGDFFAIPKPDRTWATINLADLLTMLGKNERLTASIKFVDNPEKVEAHWNGVLPK